MCLYITSGSASPRQISTRHKLNFVAKERLLAEHNAARSFAFLFSSLYYSSLNEYSLLSRLKCIANYLKRTIIFTQTYDNGRDIRLILQLRESKHKKENLSRYSGLGFFVFPLVSKVSD